MKFLGWVAVLSAATGCSRDVPAPETDDAVADTAVADTDGGDILASVDVLLFETNGPDASHDTAGGPVQVPRFQCGLEEGVAPSEPIFMALPPYVSTGGDAIVADMTGDGIPEVLSWSTLYLNGTTIPVEGPQLSAFSHQYAYGDFDGDGLWDVIGYASSKQVGLRRQSQLGVFEENLVVLSLAEASDAWFVAANLEGDETPEVVIVDGKRLRAYRFNPTTKSLAQIGEGYAEGVKLGVPFGFDVNQDGFDEIVYGGVHKFLDNGTVTHLVDDAQMPTSPWVTHYEIFDIDLDGQKEVVGYSSQEQWVVIRPGAEPVYETTTNWFPGLDTWALGDLNGDGLDELLVGNDTDLWLYGRTGLSEFVELAHAPGKAVGRPPVLDVDLDGDQDVYQTGPVLFENHGPLGFEAHYAPSIDVWTPSYDGVPQYPTDPTEERDASCTCLPAKNQGAAVDFDDDGMDDIVIASSGTVTVARSLGDGRFGPQVKVAPNVSTYDPARWVGFELETPDLNGDGRPEIVALTRNTEWHCNQDILWVAYSVKDDFSLEPFELPIDNPHGVDFGDVDGNGLVDIVSFHPWDMSSPTWSTDEHCQPVEYLDRDEAAERMPGCCHQGNPSAGVKVTLQVTPGVFESGPLTPLRAEAAGYGCTFDEGFSVVDGMLLEVTGDGKLDLVATHAHVAPDAIDVVFKAPRGIACYPCEWILRAPSWRISGAFLAAHPGDGKGGFAPGRTIGGTAYDAVRSLGHADLDGDGDEDLLVTTDFWRGVLENPGTELESPDLGGPVCDPTVLKDLDSAPFERNTLNWWAADWMRPANLNGDRCVDFAPAVYFKAYGIGSVQTILGDGVGPGSWNYVGIPGTSATSYDNVIPGDYDGDGLDDLYVITNTWSGVPARVLLNRTPRPTLRPERTLP